MYEKVGAVPPDVGDVPAVDVLHRDVPVPLGEAEVVDLRNVRVRERREQAPLVLEHPELSRMLGEVLEETLDDDVAEEAARAPLPREEDLRHATGSDLPDELVATEAGSVHVRGGLGRRGGADGHRSTTVPPFLAR